MDCLDAYVLGRDDGEATSKWTDFPDEDWVDEDTDEVPADRIDEFEEAFGEHAGEANMNSRSYSPWEQRAQEFNEAPNSEELWECYEEGVGEGIEHGKIRRFSLDRHSDEALRDYYKERFEELERKVKAAQGETEVPKSRKDRTRLLNAPRVVKRKLSSFPGDFLVGPKGAHADSPWDHNPWSSCATSLFQSIWWTFGEKVGDEEWLILIEEIAGGGDATYVTNEDVFNHAKQIDLVHDNGDGTYDVVLSSEEGITTRVCWGGNDFRSVEPTEHRSSKPRRRTEPRSQKGRKGRTRSLNPKSLAKKLTKY